MADGSRSIRPDVRNPLVRLPAFKRLRDALHGRVPVMPQDILHLADQALKEMQQDMAANGEKAWRKSKPPMAAYWKSASVYTKHIRRVLR